MTHVLLVDDDIDLVSSNKSALEAKGYRVSCAYSGQEGIDFIRKQTPDIVVLDCMMEEFTAGFEVAQDIALTFPSLPMIMLTSVHEQMSSDWNYGPEDKEWLPVHKFLEKPVKPADLAAEIERLVKSRK